MANIIVVGAQWGDESKGKIVDYLTPAADMVVRYGGGNNAGHSVMVGSELYKLHLVPSGILHSQVTCVLSDGVVIDPGVLVTEIEGLKARGVSFARFLISASAHVILPYHCLFDRLNEERRGADKIGTTGRGVGPAYSDKAARCGIRMGEFIDPVRFEARLKVVLEEKNAILTQVYGAEPLSLASIIAEYRAYAEALKPYVAHIAPLVYQAAKSGKGVVFEGAQGTLLDLDLGTYPYVTSSHPIAAGACLGTGVGPLMIDGVIGIVKSYTTRVGAGVFPTEQLNDIGDYIRERGHEYGTTTGRPRRCGWLDAVVLRYASQINSLTCISTGHLDVLAGLESVKICTAYKTDSGETLQDLPWDLSCREDVEPVYETLPGWGEEVSKARAWEDLPVNARAYVERIETLTGLPAGMISVGPGREETIVREAVLSAALGSRR